MQIEHKYKSQKTSQDKRTQDMAPATDKSQCEETLDQFFLYVLQDFSRERDSTYTTDVNLLTYLNKSRDLL